MKFGKFPASLIPFITAFVGGGSVIIIYFIAVYLGHQKPLPNTWISRTAQHYPQFLFFRFGTISGAVFMIISYFINHFIITQKAYNKVFNIRKYKPEIILVLGIMGALFIMGSTALIDTGKMNGNLHVFCAGNFFVWSILANWYNAYIGWVLYKKAKAGNKILTYTKILIGIFIIIQAYIDLTNKLSENNQQNQLNSKIGNVLEYTISFSVISIFVIIGLQARKYNLIYDMKE